MKLKMFEENNKDIMGNKIRFCANPECRMKITLYAANIRNKITPEQWNSERVGFLCCFCFKIVEKLKDKSIETIKEFIMMSTNMGAGIDEIYGGYLLLPQRIEGLRKLKLIGD